VKRLLCAVLAALLLLPGCGAPAYDPAKPHAPAAPTVVPAGDPAAPQYVALTFDDGPSPRCTPRLLDGLAACGARATFFVVGCQTVKDPDIVRRIAAEGHQVGNHSYDHAQLDSLTCEQALADLRKNDDLLRELLGEGDYWVRPPYGLCSDSEAAHLTVPLVNWSVDTEDWKSKDADKIVDMIYRQVSDGDIILLHDRYQNTVDAVLRAVPHLQEQGYVFVTVAELLALRGVTPEPGVTYRRAPPQEAEGG
jgi:peptidoglycan/xylan/chitin deacetylase (PgdA/CDA1 family)